MSSCTNVLSWAWSQPATIVPPNRQEIRRQSPRGLAMGTKAACERIRTMAQISQLLLSIFLRNLSNGWSASLYKIHIQIWGFGKCPYCIQRFFPMCSGQLKRGGSFPGSLHAEHTIINITSTLSMSHAPGKWKEPGLMFCLFESNDQQSWEAKETAEEAFWGRGCEQREQNSLWQAETAQSLHKTGAHCSDASALEA